MPPDSRSRAGWFTGLLSILSLTASAQPLAPTHQGVEYARVEGHALLLDVYLPVSTGKPPRLIVWVHGGAWRSGSRERMPLDGLVAAGYAVASVDYRLTPVAPFPAQIHDLKAAVRFLRVRAQDYGFRADRIAIAGASAGGHLAALVGVTHGHPDLEGTIGGHLGTSSDVQAILNYYGASNLETILSQSTPHGLGVRIPALNLLLGDQPENCPERARLASPVHHVDAMDPPLLLIHGDQDPQMPINQAHELQGVYQALGLPVQFEVIHGAAHGGPMFYDAERNALALAFLKRHLR